MGAHFSLLQKYTILCFQKIQNVSFGMHDAICQECLVKEPWRIAMFKVEMLERKRLEKGLSYTDIAKSLGLNKVTVSRTLNGVTMKPHTVKLLADYLGVDMGKMLK